MERAFLRVAVACASAALLAIAPRAAAQSVSPVDLSALAAGAEQKDPTVAFDGTSFLLVWQEGFRIWGARLDVGGALVGTRFAIADSGDPSVVQTTPAVAASASGGFFVVWAEEAGTASQWDVRGARVSAEGLVLDASGFDVSTVLVAGIAEPAPGAQERPAVAAGGTGFLVVWQDGRADALAPDVFGARVASGAVLDADGIAISQQPTVQRRPSLAWNGASYLVAWEDAPVAGAYDVFGARVSAAGVAEPDFPISAASGDQLEPSVASRGSAFLVAWNDQRSGTAWDLTAARVDGTGVLDPAGIVLAGVDASAPHAVSSDGFGYLVAYERSASGAVAKRLAASGAAGTELTIDSTGVVPPGQALAFAGFGRHLEVHREDASGTPRLAAALVTTFERVDVARAGTGTGSVTSAPAGISCGASCAADFETGSDVLLTATADAGSTFGSWSGCAAPVGATCTVTLSSPVSVTATFALDVPGMAGVPTYTNIGETSLTVSWAAAPGATSHELERAPDEGGTPGTYAQVFAGAAASYPDTGLAPGTIYWYRARGTNAAGAGAYGSATSVTTALPLPPAAPAAPTYPGVGATSVTVSWSAVAGATSYAVERGSTSSGPWITVATGVVGTSHVDPALAENTTYWYRVRGTNIGGDGDFSAASSVTTLPGAPGAPTFSGVTASSVVVGWTAPAGTIDGYDLERGTTATGPWTTVATGIAGLSVTDAGPLAAGTTYWYQVRAVTAAGPGAYSAASQAITLPAASTAPTYSSVGATSVTVSWSAVTGATSYDLERAPSATGPWSSVAADLTATSHADATLSPNVTYWYRVRATNASGDGAYSAESSVTTLPGAPGTPTYGAVTASGVTVSWAAPAGGATSYEVERAPDGGGVPGSWTEIAAAVVATTYDSAGLAANTAYWYRVRATNASGDGAYSSASTVTTLPAGPGTPTFSSITTTSVVVGWTAPAGGATSYEVEQAPDDGAGAPGAWTQLAAGVTATSYPSAGLAKNARYWYRVRATNASGTGGYSTAASVATLPDPPGVPTFASVTTATLIVSWTPPADGGAASYDLDRGTSATGPWTSLATATTALAFADSGLTAGATYWYRVRGANSDGLRGAYSTASIATLPAAAPAPTYSSVGATSVTVSWGAVTGATSYDLERGPTSAGPWTSAAADVIATSYADATLSPNTTWWYRVRATNASGDGAFSAASSVTTLPGAPGAPAFSAVGANGVTLSWTAPAGGASSYKVERALDGGGAPGAWTEIAAGVASTTFASGGLAPNTIYWYRVRATNAAGDGAYSAASSVTTLPGGPGTPTFSAVTTTSLVVSWTAPAGGATSYDVERAASSGGPFTPVATAVAALSHADAGLAAGTIYWYRVRANTAAGSGAYSAAAQVITLPEAPGAPTFTNIAATSLRVSWTAPVGAASYKLERAPDTGANAPGTWTQIAGAILGTSFDSTGLGANTKYWYRVRATNASGDGAYSPQASVVTLPAPPGTPTFSSVTTISMTVSWAAPAGGAASYDLDRGTTATGPWTSLAAGTTALSFADGGLDPGTTYWYRVRATNSDGLSTAYAIASRPTLPSAPGAPATSVTAFAVTLSWSPVTGATSYKLERAPDDGTGNPGAWTQIAAVGLTTYEDAGRSPNTTYWYRLRATNASGDGAYSPAASATTLPNAPGKPTFSSITDTSLTVSWTAPVGGAASYELERSTSALGPWTQVATGIAALSQGEAGLTAGTTYFYRVRAASSAGGFGAWSPIASVSTLPGAPGAPTFSEVSALSLTVSWTAIAGALRYHLERAPDVSGAPGTWVSIAAGLLDTQFNDANAANTVYWYRVRGWNESGFGPYSTASTVTTLPGTPGAPTFTAVTSTGVTVQWTAPTGGAASYVVYRATSSLGPWTAVATVTTLFYADTGLSPATQYWYLVKAANATGASGPSPIAAVTTLPAAPSGAPGAPTFSAVGTGSVTLAWTDTTGAASYKVERAPDAGGVPGTWIQIASSLLQRSYADGGLAANTKYWYRVRGSTAGGDGPYSTPSSVVTLPNAPGALSFASVTATSVAVSWEVPAGGAAAYELQRGPSAIGPWGAAVVTVAPSYTDAGLGSGTTYWYRVRAKNSAGATGAFSPSASVTTLTSAPGAPAYLNVGVTSLTVVWSAAAGAASYRLERGPTSTGAWAQIGGTITGTSYLDGSATANATYWYRVCAVNGAAVLGGCSASTTTTMLPGAPGTPTFGAVSTASVTVSWTAPSGGAASYKVERAASATGPWSLRATGVTGLSFVDSGLAPNTTYHYRVRATNVLNRDGAYSASASVATSPDGTTTPPGAIAAPTYGAISATGVNVLWAAAAGATSYAVERAPDAAGAPGAWTHIASTTFLGYLDGGRTANTRYWYRVRASNVGGSSTSAASSAVTAPNPPGPPAFTSVAVTTLTVSWSASAGGAASYKVERGTSSLGPWTQIATGIVTTSYADAGLAGGTTYYYRLRATNAAGVNSVYTGWRSVTTLANPSATPPPVPGTPTFASVASSSLKASWAPSAGATSYKLERATAAAGPWTQIAAIAATSFTDTGRSANTTYWYRVRASNQGADSAYSPSASVTTAPGVPGPPTFTGVAPNAVMVSWAAPFGGAVSYKIERSVAGSTVWTQLASGVTALTYVSGGLWPNTTYSYRVRATNSAGLDGLYSYPRSVTTLPDPSTPLPGAPGEPTYSAIGASSVKVSWTAGADATSYDLERAGASSGPWTRIATLTATSFGDTRRAANTTYWYRVRGSNGGGAGAYSAASSVTTAPAAPGAPTYSAITSTGVTVSWTPPLGGAATYLVERLGGTSSSATQIASGLTSPNYTDAGLAPNTRYYYRVRAANADGVIGAYSAWQSVLTAAAAPGS